MTTLFDLTTEVPAAATAVEPPARYRVAGLDISLTGTGVATLGGTTLITSTGHRKDTIPQRRTRLKRIADDIFTALGLVDLVVIEGPSHHSVGGSVWDRGGLWWIVVDRLCANAVPVAVMPPTSRAKYATGSGAARKAAVMEAARHRYGAILDNDNEADALVLRAAGMDWLGTPLADVPDGHRAALAGVQWPDREAVTRR